MKKFIKKTLALLVCVAVLSVMLVATAFNTSAEKYNPNTDWMAGKYGISMHYLHENAGGQGSTVETFSSVVDSFDVKKFAKVANEVGASWVLITMSQSTGVTCAPQTYMSELSGLNLGVKRDLVLDVYDALEPYGIKLMLYFHGGVVKGNAALARAMGAVERVGQTSADIGQSSGDYLYKYSTAKHQAEMFKEFSLRYGEKVSGWWIDGCYNNCDFNDRIAKLYTTALKAGNPNAIVALNGGTRTQDCRFTVEDYHCGERWSPTVPNQNTIYKDNPNSRWTETGYQQHYWAYLGSNWGQPGTSHKTDELVEQAYKIVSSGAGLTFDICSTGVDKTGTIDAEQLKQLKAIRDYIKSKPAYKMEETPAVTEQEDTTSLTEPTDTSVENTETKVEVKEVSQNKWLYLGIGIETLLIIGAVVLIIVKKKKSKV